MLQESICLQIKPLGFLYKVLAMKKHIMKREQEEKWQHPKPNI